MCCCNRGITLGERTKSAEIARLTDITPYRRDNVDVVGPDNCIGAADKTRKRNPDCIHAYSSVPWLQKAGAQGKNDQEEADELNDRVEGISWVHFSVGLAPCSDLEK